LPLKPDCTQSLFLILSHRLLSISNAFTILLSRAECIKILLSILLGIVLAYFQVFDETTFVPTAVKFAFHVALPLHILRGIGIGVDFYDPNFEWNYICAFLVLRAIALVVSFAWVLAASLTTTRRWREKKQQQQEKPPGIGQVAVLWLALTWISTVILGVPISKAVFGSEALGLFYGLLAGISSFIFQLPLQLVFLECHLLEQEYFRSTSTTGQSDGPSHHSRDDETIPDEEAPNKLQFEEVELEERYAATADQREENEGVPQAPLLMWLQFARRRDVLKRVAIQVCTNPVILGIAGGFLLSLSTIGPRFLNPTSPEFVPGLGWVVATTAWFGDMFTPLSLFTMGVWMQNQGRKLFRASLFSLISSMVSKLILVPLLMVGLAKAFKLSNDAGRAAVLIATLPISLGSFSLGSRYKTGEELLSGSVALGSALMLPTVLIWNLAMDQLKLFPIHVDT